MKNIVAHSLEKLYKESEELDQNFLDSDMKDIHISRNRLPYSAKTSKSRE